MMTFKRGNCFCAELVTRSSYPNMFVISGIYVIKANGGSTVGQLYVQGSKRK
jgi:hypothetical protein